MVTANGNSPLFIPYLAEFIEEGDPRRGRAIRDLILRYGTPSEGLGSGPIFLIRPLEPS